MFKIRIMRGKIPLDSGIISQWVQFSAEKALAPHSSPLAWKVPWMQEPGGLQSMGLLGVGHDWATSLSLFTFMRWRRNGNPLLCSCLENPRDGGAWWAAASGVAQSRTRLKWLSSSSSSTVQCCWISFPCHLSEAAEYKMPFPIYLRIWKIKLFVILMTI